MKNKIILLIMFFLLLGCNALNISYFNLYSFTYQLLDDSGNVITDSSTINKAVDIIKKKIEISNIFNVNVMKKKNKIIVTSDLNDESVILQIHKLVESDLEVSFRDETGNLLATGDEMLDKVEPASAVIRELPYVTLNLSKSGVEIFDNQIMDKIEDDGKVVVWLGYTGPDDHSEIDKTDDTIVMDSFAEYQNLATIVSQSGISILSAKEILLYKYYDYKILTFATISEDLKNQGGLSGIGQDKLVLNSDFTSSQANSIVSLISNKNFNFTFDLLGDNE